MSIKPGIFITMEGGEGCGKTTQLRLLSERLKEEGYRVLVTREPGGCPIAEKIRKILLDPDHTNLEPVAEFFLFVAARSQHVREVIAPALEKGYIVISDRFFDSSYVYQKQVRKCVDSRLFMTAHQYALDAGSRFCNPNITLLLDVDVEIGHERALARNVTLNDQGEARFDNEAREFHTKVNEEFRALAETEKERFIVIDANQSITDIAKNIYDEVIKHVQQIGGGES